MSNILDYVVITSSKGVENLESLIKQNISLGWRPIGGIAVMNSTVSTSAFDSDEPLSKPVLLQAMAKFDS